MARTVTWRDRLRYRFDATLARGTIGVIGWLGLVTLCVVVAAGLIVWIVGLRVDGANETTLVEGIWTNLMRALDPGALGADTGWTWRIVALAVTISGIFVLSILIGIISSGIEARLEELRKGRSLVVEHGHTLILGWSPKLHQILAELEVANENQRDPVVVILADRDKIEMEDAVRQRAAGRRLRVICRSGLPSDPEDLEIVRPEAAKSILVLLDDTTGDPGVVKTVLALLGIDPELERLRVTAEFACEDSAAAIDRATHGRMAIVVSSDVIARVTAQVCRQSGLSVAFQELLDFAGDEIYFHAEPALVGRTFGASLTAFTTSSVIGVRGHDGSVLLSPPMGRVFKEGDQVIAISADDDTIRLVGDVADVPLDGQVARAVELVCEHTLLVGWNDLAGTILSELDRYVLPGSTVRLLVDPTKVDEGPLEIPRLAHTAVDVVEMDTVNGHALTEHVAGRAYDQMIILCYRTGDVAMDDAHTLLTLLQIRQATQLPGSPNMGVRLVTELLDVRDVDLARVANPDDFVVSDRLTSLMLAQLVENIELRGVFKDLFDAAGVELVLVPASRYGASQTYGDVVAAARTHGHVAVGYRSSADGVIVNPAKTRPIALTRDDQVLILA